MVAKLTHATLNTQLQMRYVYQIHSTDSYKCLRGKIVLSFMTSDSETIESC